MYKIYTDGGCRGNPGLGSWAMVVYQQVGHAKYHKGNKTGYSAYTTNNEMELTAVVQAVNWAIRGRLTEIEIFTDSAYVCNGFNQWMEGWKKRMWKTSSGGRVKNLELWRDLYHSSKKLNITLTKVKGHSGDEGNEKADLLCNCVMDEWELQNVVMK